MIKIFASIFAITFLMACSQTQDVQETPQVLKKDEAPKVQKVTSTHDGTYIFDTEKYKQVQLEKNKLFKKMKPKDQELMMKIFRPFQITVQGNQATASFAHDVVKGNLTTMTDQSGVTRFHMTPLDASKKDQTVTLIIEENDLVLDPGKKETDKMYFKRVN